MIEIRCRARNNDAASPHYGAWLTRPGLCPFDPPGTRRWTRLPGLAALYPSPLPGSLPPGCEPDPVSFNTFTGQIEADAR